MRLSNDSAHRIESEGATRSNAIRAPAAGDTRAANVEEAAFYSFE
jgi:hypothetical protein